MDKLERNKSLGLFPPENRGRLWQGLKSVNPTFQVSLKKKPFIYNFNVKKGKGNPQGIIFTLLIKFIFYLFAWARAKGAKKMKNG